MLAESNYTWLPKKEKLTRPIYLSLASELEKAILSGALPPGAKLPPQRILANEMDINFTTVTRAYKICIEKGLICAEVGRGTFVSPGERSFENAINGISGEPIDLSFISYFEEGNDLVREAIQRVSKKKYLDMLLDFKYPSGMPHHKKAALEWLSFYGLNVGPEQLAITSGKRNSIAITFAALFKPGNCIATDSHVLSTLIDLARLFHIKLIPVAGDENGMLPDELDRLCKSESIQGIFLMPTCNNPTTVVTSEVRKEELAAVIRRHQLILIEDDAYAFLTTGSLRGYQQPMYSLLPENTVYIMDCGMLSSGLRISYMVFGNHHRERLHNAMYTINVKTPSLNAEVITELLVSGAAQKIISTKINLARQVNGIFRDHFPETADIGHPLSLFKWLPIFVHRNALYVESYMLRHGIIVSHSDRFLSGPSQPDSFLRVSLTYARTPERLRAGLMVLKEQLNELMGSHQ